MNMNTFYIDKLWARQWTGNSGAPIVLSHALGLNHSMWLDPRDAQTTGLGKGPVLAYDHRGHGKSISSQGPYTQADLVSDAERIIEAWGRGPVVWVGLSLGGMVGQGLAIRRPDLISALVLAHTTSQYPPQAALAWDTRIKAVKVGGMAAVADMVVSRYLSEPFRQAYPDKAQALHEQLTQTDPLGYTACCHAVATVNWLEQLYQIQCPTLVLAGAHDVGAPPEMARDIANHIPNAQLHIFSNSAHLSPTEEPELFRATVQTFIKNQ